LGLNSLCQKSKSLPARESSGVTTEVVITNLGEGIESLKGVFIMKPALLVIDVQKEFFKANAQTVQSLNNAIEYINAGIALFREKGLPILCVQHMDEADKLVPGAQGFDLPEELQILPSDGHIHKTYGNAFNKTELLRKLKELDVDTVVISGYCAEFCVLATYRGAEDVDLMPMLLRGGLASGSPENIKFVENISDIISYGALRKVLG
jgi:nicotinamidase-related amidase